jgi:hypothetical protein
MKTEIPSRCLTVNCKVCRSATGQFLPVVPSCVNKIESYNPEPVLQVTHKHPTRDNINRKSHIHQHVYFFSARNKIAWVN